MLMNWFMALAISSTLTFKCASSCMVVIEEAQSCMHPCMMIIPSLRAAEERAEIWIRISVQLPSFSTIPRIPRACPSIFLSRESKSSFICCVKDETFIIDFSFFRAQDNHPTPLWYTKKIYNRFRFLSSESHISLRHGARPLIRKSYNSLSQKGENQRSSFTKRDCRVFSDWWSPGFWQGNVCIASRELML